MISDSPLLASVIKGRITDRRARSKKRNEILREMRLFTGVPSRGIFPNFGPSQKMHPDEFYGVKLNRKDIQLLVAKIIRGIAFVEDGIFIDENYDLSVYFLEDEGAEPVVNMIDQYGVQLHRGPGLLVRRAVIPEDRRAGLYAVEIWQRAKMYAAILPKDIANVSFIDN